MGYLYLIPLIVAIFMSFLLINSTKISKSKLQIDKPFKSDFFNDLYGMSYLAPFVWFINPEENDERAKDIRLKLAEANLNGKLNYRSFVTLQILIFIGGILMFFILSVVIDNSQTVIRFLFNVSVDNMGDSGVSKGKVKLFIGMAMLALVLIPKMWLKQKAENNKYFYLKDIPVVQLFIILMLRSKRTLGEVLYVLARTNTRYKQIFETGYRIYLRNKSEGFEYIKSCFAGTKFEETIQILQDYNEYSHSDSIIILENNMQEMIEFTNNLKRKNDLSKLLYSQGSLFVPFLSIILLGLVPMAMYGKSFLSNASK